MTDLELKAMEYAKFEFVGEQHPRIKQVKAIISNTKSNPEKLFIAEGIWAGRKIVDFSTPIKCLIICPEFIHTPETIALLKELLQRTDYHYAVSAKTFQKISERDKPDGILAIAQLPVHDLNKFKLGQKAIILVLDGVEIPGNIGTMLRMSDGAGVDAVFICNRKARLSHPKLVKGSMGAVLSVPIFEFEDISDCHDWLKKNQCKIYLADTRAKHSYFEEPFNCRAALVMGSERYGISRDWYTDDIIMISIPMLGNCDSLNVGVAATVLIYEAMIKNKFGARK